MALVQSKQHLSTPSSPTHKENVEVWTHPPVKKSSNQWHLTCRQDLQTTLSCLSSLVSMVRSLLEPFQQKEQIRCLKSTSLLLTGLPLSLLGTSTLSTSMLSTIESKIGNHLLMFAPRFLSGKLKRNPKLWQSLLSQSRRRVGTIRSLLSLLKACKILRKI